MFAPARGGQSSSAIGGEVFAPARSGESS